MSGEQPKAESLNSLAQGVALRNKTHENLSPERAESFYYPIKFPFRGKCQRQKRVGLGFVEHFVVWQPPSPQRGCAIDCALAGLKTN